MHDRSPTPVQFGTVLACYNTQQNPVTFPVTYYDGRTDNVYATQIFMLGITLNACKAAIVYATELYQTILSIPLIHTAN